jgi:tyramine---L-glutamate ligase
MRIAVLEYLCGGGLADVESSQLAAVEPLYGEGDAMLSALVEDLMDCGHHVVTVLDDRSNALWQKRNGSAKWANQLHAEAISSTQSLNDVWMRATRDVERVLVIAPEIDDILGTLIEELRTRGRTVWASERSFLQMSSDKQKTYSSLLGKVKQPPTWTIGEFFLRQQSASNEYQSGWVVKPRDGAGCSDMKWYATCDEFLRETKLQTIDSTDKWIVQAWEEGQAYSLVMIGNQRQNVPVIYTGGRGPVMLDSYPVFEAWGRAVLESLPGALGWVGIDFVWSEVSQEPVLIEINPRLTTSYLAYRKLYGPAISEELMGLRGDLAWQVIDPFQLPFPFSAS